MYQCWYQSNNGPTSAISLQKQKQQLKSSSNHQTNTSIAKIKEEIQDLEVEVDFPDLLSSSPEINGYGHNGGDLFNMFMSSGSGSGSNLKEIQNISNSATKAVHVQFQSTTNDQHNKNKKEEDLAVITIKVEEESNFNTYDDDDQIAAPTHRSQNCVTMSANCYSCQHCQLEFQHLNQFLRHLKAHHDRPPPDGNGINSRSNYLESAVILESRTTTTTSLEPSETRISRRKSNPARQTQTQLVQQQQLEIVVGMDSIYDSSESGGYAQPIEPTKSLKSPKVNNRQSNRNRNELDDLALTCKTRAVKIELTRCDMDSTSTQPALEVEPPLPLPLIIPKLEPMSESESSESQDPKPTNLLTNSSLSGKPYSCQECGKGFISHGGLIYHQRTRSHTGTNTSVPTNPCLPSRKPFLCQECGKEFLSYGGLIGHQRSHTGEKPFSCRVCSKSFAHSRGLVYHTSTQHGHGDVHKPYFCTYCTKTFPDPETLTSHSRRHSGLKPYSCTFCNIKWAHHASLTYHIRKFHKEQLLVDSTLLSTKTLKKGNKTLIGLGLGRLKKSTVNSSLSIGPLRRTAEQKKYSCDNCPLEFGRLMEFKTHLRTTHSQQSISYLCQYCGETFKNSTKLSLHVRTHTSRHSTPKPFSCDNCGRTFTSYGAMRMHVHACRRSKKICPEIIMPKLEPECLRNLPFPTLTLEPEPELPHIVEIHQNARRNPGRGRPKKLTKSILEVNIYSCQFCDKTFGNNPALSQHILTHTKPNVCPLCDQRFGQVSQLTSHTTTHHKS